MRRLRTTVIFSVVAMSVTSAGAQFGLYGSPEVLNLSQPQPAMAAYGGYAQPPASAVRGNPTGTFPTQPGWPHPGPMVRTVSDYRSADPAARLPAEPAPPKTPESPAEPPAYGGPPPTGNLIDQMLAEAGDQQSTLDYGGAGSECATCGEADVCDDLASCGAGYLCNQCCSPWYASASVLVMGRDEANRVFTTYEIGNESNNELLDDGLRWRWGGEIRFGRRFCCDKWALEATYWGLDSFRGFASATHPNTVGTPLVVSGIEFPNPSPPPAFVNGTSYFDNATEHRLWRQDEVHSVELNLVRRQASIPSDFPWQVDWLMGVRFFRFDENFTFGSVASPYVFGQYGGIYEAYIHDQVTNDLVGFQFGFDADYYVVPRCRLYLSPKFGIMNNQIDQYFHIYRGDGVAAQPTAASGQTGSFPVRSSEDNISFLMQVDLGVQWDFARNWSARIGYRVLALTGIALADHQIPPYIVDIPVIADIDTNGELVLHGAVLGVTYNF